MEKVICFDLGTIDYGKCWDLQKDLFGKLVEAKGLKKNAVRMATEDMAAERTAVGMVTAEGAASYADGVAAPEKAEQYLLLCEHPPVYTLGKSGDEGNMLVSEEFLQNRGASFFRIERGGDITFHGPGQLVGYPILDLEKEGMGLRDYIHYLEQTVIDTVAEYGISGTRVAGAAGVWLVDGGPLRKICAIGVRSSRYVTMHGFALNANTDLEWFRLINPCGFTDREVTSIARETGAQVDMVELKRRFAAQFEKKFDIKINTKDYANRETLGNQATGRRPQSG